MADGLDIPFRVHVPVDGGRVCAGRVDEVGDDQQIARHRQNMALVHRRTIAVVRPAEIVEVLGRPPAFDAAVCHVRPVKRAAGDRLRSTVEHQRVVEGGRPEPVAKRAARGVAAGAGVDEQRHVMRRQRERQGVGVRVSAVLVAVRAAVDEQMIARGRS